MTTTPLRRSYDTLINKIFRSWIENKVSKTRNLRLFLFEGTVLNYSSFACTMPEISMFFFFAFFVSRTWWYSLYNPEWLSHKKSNLLCRSLLYSASTEVEIFSSFKTHTTFILKAFFFFKRTLTGWHFTDWSLWQTKLPQDRKHQ